MEPDREAARYDVVADLFSAMESSTSIEDLAWLGAAATRELLSAATASVSRYDAETGRVRTLVNVGLLGPGEQERPVDETYAITDFPNLLKVAERQQPWSLHVDDADGDPSELGLLRRLGKTASLGCPIVLGARVWGELYVTRCEGEAFTGGDRAVARMIGQAVALCVGRLIGHHALRELVYVDPLTGLGNRRMLDETLQRRSQLGGPTTLALWDVDGLKVVNDRDGHLAGDRLLREVALLLSEAAARLPDSVATRLGGDEFCLVSAGLSGAEVVELMGDLVARASDFSDGAGVSCGVASAAAVSSEHDVKSLFRRADAALYRAKRAGGRRQVLDDGPRPDAGAGAPH